MDNLKYDRNNAQRGYRSNSDIEDVLSNEKGGVRISKVNKNDRNSVDNLNIQDKIELSSHKDIDIGLDLLANAEKKNRKQEESSSTNNVLNIEEDKNDDVDFDKLMSQGDGSDVEELLSELNVDRTSRLSKNEIDLIIDNKPNLANDNDIEYAMNKEDMNEKRDIYSEQYNVQPEETYEENNNQASYHNEQQQSNYVDNTQQYYRAPIDPVQERKDKEEILWNLEKYRRLGVQGVRKFNMSSDLDEMRTEYNKIKKQRELESSVKFQRKCLMAFVTGAEMLNNKLDFLDFRLDGWSEQVNEGIDEYNEVFEELHEKYKEKAKMAPEVKLLFMLGGSAFMYHITNSMFKNSVPGMEDIMKQNPELMKQFANAAINQMSDDKKPAANFFNQFAPGMAPPNPQQFAERPMPNRPSSSFMEPPQTARGPQPTTPRQMQSMPPNMQPRQMPMSARPKNNLREVPEPFQSRTDLVNDRTSENILNIGSTINPRDSAFNTSTKKIPAPVGVDDILNELQSNTDNISDIISRSKRDENKSINASISSKSRPKRSIALNI